MTLQISLHDAQALMLKRLHYVQRIDHEGPRSVVEKTGPVQIDYVRRVAPSAYLALWSRCHALSTQELVKFFDCYEGVFEYELHEAGIIRDGWFKEIAPLISYRQTHPKRGHVRRLGESINTILERVLEFVKSVGDVTGKDVTGSSIILGGSK
jgi:uncharacterized protein YcaQ